MRLNKETDDFLGYRFRRRLSPQVELAVVKLQVGANRVDKEPALEPLAQGQIL